MANPNFRGPFLKPGQQSGPRLTSRTPHRSKSLPAQGRLLELKDLEACENAMAEGFQQVARGLARIKEGKLFRDAGFATFEEYCQERWNFGRDRAAQLIQAETVLRTLGPRGREKIGNVGQVTALAAIPKERRVEVLKTVAASGKVTAKKIREVARGPIIEAEVVAQHKKKCPTCGGRGFV